VFDLGPVWIELFLSLCK